MWLYAAGATVLLIAYEIFVAINSPHRQFKRDDLHEDARKDRLRNLSRQGDEL